VEGQRSRASSGISSSRVVQHETITSTVSTSIGLARLRPPCTHLASGTVLALGNTEQDDDRKIHMQARVVAVVKDLFFVAPSR